MMNRIRGLEGHDVSIDSNDQLICKNPQGELLQDIHFFYACGLPEDQIKQDGGDKRKKILYQFVKFFGKEEMERFGVQFEV